MKHNLFSVWANVGSVLGLSYQNLSCASLATDIAAPNSEAIIVQAGGFPELPVDPDLASLN